LTAARDRLAEWLGLAVHRLARLARRLPAGGTRDPRRLAVVCDAFLHVGCPQAIALSQTGLEVTLYYVDRGSDFTGSEEDRERMLARVRTHGIQTVPVPRLRPAAVLSHALWLHRDLRKRAVATLVVHAHGDPRYATLGLGLPVALIVHDPQTHSGDTLSMPPWPARIVARFAEVSASCLIVHSECLVGQMRPLLRRLPLGVTPLGIDVASAPAPVPAGRRLLLFGRLFAYKGVDTALEAFALLRERLPDADLLVAGRGPLAGAARGQSGVQVREEYISEEEIGQLLGQARLVLLPYKDATQSGVGLQAVAFGVPTVVTRTGGLPDLVPDTAQGLIVAPDDPRGLAEAITAHIDHGDELRAAVHAHAGEHFAFPVAARRLREELARLGVLSAGDEL
jgi:glycosyltransferase involved in cell wall biosynthesis